MLLFAQQSSKRTRWINLKNGDLILDSLSIDPSSFQILKPDSAKASAIFDPGGNKVTFKSDSGGPDSILVTYRVFPFNLSKKIYNRDFRVYDSSKYFVDKIPRGGNYYENRDELFSTPGLTKTGTISRGVSFGNNQNVFVNSALNLQLEGRISPEISILAAISDQNIPIQPEGNTQSLQQFDRVYIQLSGKGSTLTAGDVLLKSKDSYFLKYLKNVQGGFTEVAYQPVKGSSATTSIGAAVSKGKFNSMFMDAVEGLQGPYKLRGPNNERFIIVISGSEKVYLDGRLLTRGFNYDYVIDYNQAEITFTNQVLITKFSRIRVDFEFTDKNYSRTTVVASHYQKYKNINGFFNLYSEKDNPNAPITAQISPDDIELLKKIGDTLSKAVTLGAVAAEYSTNQVLYYRRDTIISPDAKFIYTEVNPGVQVYQLTFSDLGLGNGNYNQVSSTANGKVYAWVDPVGGIKQGRYQPIRLLPVPNKKQMYNGGLSVDLNKNDKVYAEYAMSDHSQNLFSTVDSYDNVGNAVKVGYGSKGKDIGLGDYQLIGNVDYEYLDNFFRPIDRFRPIEFDRDWGTQQYDNWSTALAKTAEDHVANASAGLRKDDNNLINYRFSYRQKEGFVNGSQQQALLNKKIGIYQIKSNFFILSNDLVKTRSEWQRLSLDNSLAFKYLTPGYRYSFDRNQVVGGTRKDSIVASALWFEEHRIYLRKNDTTKLTYYTEYSFRTDNTPLMGEIANKIFSESKTWSNTAGYKPNENNTFNLLFTYRNLVNKRDTTSKRIEETIMGRIDWASDILKRHIRSELTYTAQTGREQVKEYVFIEVPTGQGQYKWIDYNEDGIKQLNEFVEGINYDEKIYVRYFTPTDRFVKAYTNNINYRINLYSPRSWRDKGRIKKLISKFSNTSSWSADRKTLDERPGARFVPGYSNIAPSDVLSNSNNIRSTLFFNRSSPSYGIDWVYINNFQRTFLFNGTDTKNNLEYQLNSRLNIRSLFNVKLNLSLGKKGLTSDYLTNRNYTILKQELNPELAFQPNESFRLTGTFQYIPKTNIHSLNNGEKAVFNNFGLEARLNQVNKRTLTLNAKYINIVFENAIISSPLGYDLLESLQPGNNFTWQANLQQKLASGLNINLNYEGRKAQDQPTVHIGRVQVSAIF